MVWYEGLHRAFRSVLKDSLLLFSLHSRLYFYSTCQAKARHINGYVYDMHLRISSDENQDLHRRYLLVVVLPCHPKRGRLREASSKLFVHGKVCQYATQG